jgi:hypothetical protein
MNVSGYSPGDIKLFKAVLDASMSENIACGADVPLDLMTMRLFKAAGEGERDPRRLVEAVLGLARTQPQASASPFPQISTSL